jgi:hypothetical protein
VFLTPEYEHEAAMVALAAETDAEAEAYAAEQETIYEQEMNMADKGTATPIGGKIFGALTAIMGDIGPIAKDKRNQQQGYNFRGIDDVYNELHASMSKHKVFTTTEVLEQTREERKNRSGGALIYSILKILFTFWADDGSSVKSIVIGEGMDSGDKASNKAMAVAHKYALLQVFCVPTADAKDPENDSPEPAPRQQQSGNFGNGGNGGGNSSDSNISQKQARFLSAKMAERVIDVKAFLQYLGKHGYTSGNGFNFILKSKFDEVLKLVETRVMKPQNDPVNQDPTGPAPTNVEDDELPF